MRPRVEELQELLHRTIGIWDEVVCCHNDLDPSNIIVVSNRTYLIDWEWSGPGDRVCDIATFCDLCNFDERIERRVLSEYFGEEALDASRGLLQARLQLWRLWFVVRGSLWAAVKAARRIDETKEVCDYAEYATAGWKTLSERFDTQPIAAAMEQVKRALDTE